MASIDISEQITIVMTDDERAAYLWAYAQEHFRLESRQVMRDVMHSSDGDINMAFSQGAINDMVIAAIEVALAYELTTEGIINGSQ